MTSTEVHVASININKISQHKLKEIVKGITASLVGKRPDIIFVQETKLASSAQEEAARALLSEDYDFHHNTVYCIYAQFKHGCGVYVRRASPLYSAAGAHFLPTFDWDIEGRVCVWDAGALGLFVGVYLPTPNLKRERDAKKKEIAGKPRGFERRQTIDNNLSAYLQKNKERVTVVTGDFNVVQAAIDSRDDMWTGNYELARIRFAKLFIKDLDLQDTFRVMHKDAKKFSSLITHTEDDDELPKLARIDLMLVPRRLVAANRLRAADVLNGPFFVPSEEVVNSRSPKRWNFGLDHVPVVVTLLLAPLSLDMLAPVPTKVEQDGPFHSKVTLLFTPPSMAVTGYTVKYHDGINWLKFDISGEYKGAIKKGLEPETFYRFKIRALAGTQEGPWSPLSTSTPALLTPVPITKRPASPSPHPEQPSSKKPPSHESA